MRCFLCAALLAALTVLAGPCRAGGLSFAEAISLASREAPTLQSTDARLEAARTAAIPAGALPDPKLLLGLDNLPLEGPDAWSLSRDFMTMRRVGLMQEFPSGAKRAARVADAQGRMAVAEAQGRVSRLDVMRQTALAWIARESAENQLALFTPLTAENQLLEASVRARLLAGQGSSTDAVLARQEAAALEERRDALLAQREQALAQLRQWLGRAAAESALEGSSPDWPIEHEVLLHGLDRHPEIQMLNAQQQLLDAGVAEAQAAKHPDWSVEMAYQKRGAPFGNMVSLQLSLDLPVFAGSRQNPLLAARRAERRAFDGEREAMLREHAQVLESALAEYRRLRNAVERGQRVVLPLAEEKVALATASWRGGKGSLAELIAARRERLDARLKLASLQGAQQQVAASLHYTYWQEQGEAP